MRPHPRYAMVAQLRKPRASLEDALRAHFSLSRRKILRQCAAWVAEAEDPTRKQRMADALGELKVELNKLRAESKGK